MQAGKGRNHIKAALGLSMWKTRDLMAEARAIVAGQVSQCPELKTQEQIKLDAQFARLKRDRAEVERKYKALMDEMDQQERWKQEVLGLRTLIESSDPRKFAVMDSGQRSQSTAFMIASDWHVEETVEPGTVEAVNQYDLAIAKARIERFFQNGLKLVEMCRSRSNIDTLVLAVLGDLITGYIHEELVEGNQLSPTEASYYAYEQLTAGLDLLVEHGGFRRIIVPCCWGNHGRTTERPRIATAAQNSYEWLLYRFLLAKYQDHPVVSMKLPEGYHNYLEVYGQLIRFHHGDGIRYSGGVGGLHIPLNKAIAQWNKFKRAYLDVLGHWHSRKSSSDYITNGSIIGFNAYSIRIKADFEPPCQSFFLMHPQRGKTVEAPIHVE